MVAVLCVAWWDKARLHFQSSGPGMAGNSDAFVIEADSTSEAGVAREESTNGLKGGQFRSGQIAEDGRTGVGWGQWAYPGRLGWLPETDIDPVVKLYLQGLFGEALGIEAETAEEFLYQGHALVILGEPNRAIELYSRALARDEGLATQVSVHLSMARSLRGEVHLWGEVDIQNHGRAMEQVITAVRHVPDGDIDIALSEIDTLLSDWNRWSELERQEVRVAIASHPAMERLRAHPGLLSLLYRHMGSTAPSRMR